MGVRGLWRLLEPAASGVRLDRLAGEVLAVDISIWLHQAIKGFRDSKEASLANAHLLALFRRLCKLLYYKIKPVFVFDGSFPALKRQTILNRQNQKAKMRNDVDKIRKKLLEVAMKSAAIRSITTHEASPAKKSSSKHNEDDIFKLPALEKFNAESSNESEEEKEEKCNPTLSKFSHINLHSIDVNSEDFKKLSARERHDILSELKETRKQNSWGHLDELPSNSDNFSNYQMDRLLKRRRVQVTLEETEKEIGGRNLTLNELEILLNEEGIDTKINSITTRQIASNENAKFILVKNIQEALNKATELEESKQVEKSKESTSKDSGIIEDQTLGTEYDENLKLALKLSMNNSNDSISEIAILDDDDFEPIEVESESDSELNLAIELSLKTHNNIASSSNSDTNKKKTAFFNLAKAYMSEYSGLSEHEVNKILNDTQNKSKQKSAPINTNKNQMKNNENYIIDVKDKKSEKEDLLKMSDSSSNCFEEVADNPCMIKDKSEFLETDSLEKTEKLLKESGNTPFNKTGINELKSSDSDSDCFEEVPNESSILEGVEKIKTSDDDIFADVFENEDDSKLEQLKKNIAENLKKTPYENFIISNKLHKEDKPIITMSDYDGKVIEQSKNISNDNINEEQNVTLKVNKNETEQINTNEDTRKADIIELIYSGSDSDLEEVPEKSLIIENVDMEKNDSESIINRPKPTLTKEMMLSMEENLEEQRNSLVSEQNKLDRMGLNVTEQMTKEAQELLKLFGVPFIIAPMEAEAQCAFLESIKLTNGTITDDSDIWLFGGKTVYRNFFDHEKHVLKFIAENIENSFKLKREDLILLALLVGSDYTLGISGVGPVTALEILAAFPSNKNVIEPPYSELLSGLKKFKNWLNTKNALYQSNLRKKLKNISLTEEFPNHKIIEAYLCPDVETSRETFSWGKLDLPSLVDYAKGKFGWGREKTEEILKPVIKKMNSKISQLPINSFFNVEFNSDVANLKMSKRVKKAIEQDKSLKEDEVDGQCCSTSSDNKSKAVKRKLEDKISTDEGIKKSKTRKRKNVPEHDQLVGVKIVPADKIEEKFKKQIEILDKMSKRDIIPQREADKNILLKNKLKAIELFRKSKKGPGFIKHMKKKAREPKEDAELSESDSD